MFFLVVTELVSAYCAIRAGSFNTADIMFIFKFLKVTQTVENVQHNYNVMFLF